MPDVDYEAIGRAFTRNEIREQMNLSPLSGEQGDRLLDHPLVGGTVNQVDAWVVPAPARGNYDLAHRLLFEHGLDPAWVDEFGAEEVECMAGAGRLVRVVQMKEAERRHALAVVGFLSSAYGEQ